MAMNTRQTALLACLALELSGCGLETYSTRVLEVGPDTFSVAADHPSASIAMQSAVGQAQVHCGSLSKEILVADRSARTVGDRNVYEVTFRCLAKGDPGLARPTSGGPPDGRTQDQRK
jgi:hypothetical protein